MFTHGGLCVHVMRALMRQAVMLWKTSRSCGGLLGRHWEKHVGFDAYRLGK